MNNTYFILLTVVVIAVANVAWADDDNFHFMPVCDSRCEMKNRLNPFAEGCDNCCRSRGFRKGKCKGFGWSYCMCKPHGAIRQLFNSILNNQVNTGYQQGYQG